MILKIGNRKIDTYNNVAVSLHYDGPLSAFSFRFYFDPENPDHKTMFRPGEYASVTIEDNGELLLTGYLYSLDFTDGPVRELLEVSGYSKTGVLEDCQIPVSSYPLQANKLSLKQITERIIKPFGLKLIVDPSVSKDANSVYTKSTCDDKQTIKSYISELANQKHIIVSHDEKANLLFTKVNTTQAPVFDFSKGMPGIHMSLNVDGQKMHSEITIIKQASKMGKGNAGQSSLKNPYVKNVFRPHVKRQTSGRDVDTELSARNILSRELYDGVKLKIQMDRWHVNGKIIRPNSIITITNPSLFIYNKTKFFIESVNYSGDESSQTAILNCVLPEVYNNETPKNIFA